MKTKQIKEEHNTDEETVIEPKTRARKKASDIINDEKNKGVPDEPKTSKDTKKIQPKPRALVKKRPLGIRKVLRSKKGVAVKEKVTKNVIKAKRGRKPAVKVEPESPQDKEAPLIPAAEIKKEPVEETSPNSRSSSPKTAGRRVRVSSDMAMMKTMLSDSPSTLVLGPRTSPYSMRSERSNSPSLTEAKNLRTGKPRKVKNLLSEVVIKEQKKRRRLLSDSKNPETSEDQDCKKLKRGRSCSRDGSEVSKCSDNTESDISMSETLNDSDSKETNKKLDKSKTDLDVDIENSIQIPTIDKVPSLNSDSKSAETTLDPETSIVCETTKKSSLQRSTSLDSDNNNSNMVKLDALTASDIDIEDNLLFKTEDDMLSEARSNILTSMSKTFNSKELCKNIRRARRGRKAAESRRPSRPPARPAAPKAPVTSTITEPIDDKHETIETLSKDIDDLIKNLDQNIDGDHEMTAEAAPTLPENINVPSQEESEIDKVCGLTKPLNSVDDNAMAGPETPVKEKEVVTSVSLQNTPSKLDDSENIRLHYEEDSIDKTDSAITYTKPVASIDKLMDRLKEFEEFDKRRQRLESESKPSDSKPVMVTNDVVLIHKSGAEFKPLDIQSVRSPERTIEKENVLSCFENNSAISIVKRDQVRRSVDIDLPNSVTLIKRNSVSARKESTSSNHSRESDAVTIFEKSLGKDVTLTEIRKSVDKSGTSMDLHQFAALHPGNASPAVTNMLLDHSQISITRSSESKVPSNDFQIPKRKSRENSLSQKTESTDLEELSALLAEIRKISPSASPSHQPPYLIAPVPVAIKSPEAVPVEAEALPPPLETIKQAPFIPETPIVPETPVELNLEPPKPEEIAEALAKASEILPEIKSIIALPEKHEPETMEVDKTPVIPVIKPLPVVEKTENIVKEDIKPPEEPKSIKKSLRNSIESLPGPSNAFNETPECQKRKENVLRTLGLLTHKAAKEAKIEKAKEKERIFSERMSNKGKASKSSGDYTGTLKTVIKLNRGGEKKKHRSSLKMTFQKSKYRSGKPTPEMGEAAADDSPFYTIERREIAPASSADGGQRKSHYSNRLNHHDSEPAPEPSEPKETLNLVIPEKASSFSIHPGRLCMDQCFYCGGKFGLFDTPCHIAQIKSSERQKKVLDNEEKLTIDSCLCDACYRHVDRRANCPSYRKRPLPKQSDLPKTEPPTATGEKAPSPPLEEESESDSAGAGGGRVATCHTEGCSAAGDYCIRRKWLIKMRSAVNKVLKLKGDYPGLHTLPLCGAHHRALAPLMACQLCRRRLTKHHNLHFIHHGYLDLNPLLTAANLPVQFNSRVVLCKGCRYYCSLLQRPGHNDEYANGYRRKLLQVYNIEVPPEPEGSHSLGNLSLTLSLDPGKIKKKQRNKSKQRKSTEPDMSSETSSEKTNESTPEKEQEKPIEEDIESLISSNKILVPIKAPANDVHPSDGSDENSGELPAIVSKQTELQYLLQKQNNPAQFLTQPNLTQKQRNILKIQTVSAVQKPAAQHRISEKNSKKIHKIGQQLLNKEKAVFKKDEMEIFEEKNKEGIPVLQNLNLNDECTIESIPPKRAPDINTLKNKWQMSESFTQVKKNLSELSKKLTVEKEPKKSEQKYTNPVKRLETNPSISVRELFPGEEEMNLQCSVEFNNVKGVTPEGWEKCNTTIQYDNETRKLWTELQRPYGNQSSFLRHLVLLEKYFRSGDLVLSHNASPPAANYSDSVQSRLRAYDNVVNDTPRRAEPAISLIEYRKKPAINGKSLLKSNQMDDKETKKFMPPPSGAPKLKQKDKTKKQLPPELIAINTPNAQGRKAIQNVLHNIQQLVKGVSASDPTEVASAPLPTLPSLPPVNPGLPAPAALPIPIAPPKPAVPVTPPVAKPDPPKEKKEKSDTPKKSKNSSKPWRPTLMPITPENLAKIAREPTQLAVDGRSLPSLVQVMSSGKRYHITLQDYNKMCIMRREKLQQIQDGEKKRPSLDEGAVVTELTPSAMLGNGGTVTQISDEKKEEYTSNAATILKNVGLKNITIAPIPAKTATVSSPAPMVSSPLIMTSTPIKFPQLGPAVSITSETVLTPNLPVMTSTMIMPKIPKSLTIVPQTVMASVPQSVVMTAPQVLQSDGPRP